MNIQGNDNKPRIVSVSTCDTTDKKFTIGGSLMFFVVLLPGNKYIVYVLLGKQAGRGKYNGLFTYSGGGIEKEDYGNIRNTAIRETREEFGFDLKTRGFKETGKALITRRKDFATKMYINAYTFTEIFYKCGSKQDMNDVEKHFQPDHTEFTSLAWFPIEGVDFNDSIKFFNSANLQQMINEFKGNCLHNIIGMGNNTSSSMGINTSSKIVNNTSSKIVNNSPVEDKKELCIKYNLLVKYGDHNERKYMDVVVVEVGDRSFWMIDDIVKGEIIFHDYEVRWVSRCEDFHKKLLYRDINLKPCNNWDADNNGLKLYFAESI